MRRKATIAVKRDEALTNSMVKSEFPQLRLRPAISGLIRMESPAQHDRKARARTHVHSEERRQDAEFDERGFW
jgi:hypothetical protein